jgi:cyclopropane fatty-acyl-phospholipid synthase-like methyltransferase
MGLDLYARIEGYLDFEDEVRALHRAFLKIIFEKGLDNILDVGCGQGAFLIHLNANGINSFGIDLSQEQINICQQRGLENVACMPLEKVTKQYDCATAIFDVINYIPATELSRFLQSMNLVLNQGGTFVFDVNSLFGFEEVAQGTLAIDCDDKFIAIDANFEDQQLQTDITLFSQNQQGDFTKEQDTIVQYYYEPTFLKSALNEAGFDVEEIINFNLHVDEQSDKLIFICKKQ